MGETLFSKDTPHGRFYEWAGQDFVSVTTAIKNGVAKPALVDWAARTIANIAVKAQDWDSGSPNKIETDYLLSNFEETRMSSSVTGNIVHEIAERIAKGEVIDPETLDDSVKPFVTAFMEFISDFKPKFIESEAFVASRKYGYAGTLDAIVEMNGETYVLDIKTGKNIYPEVGLQLSAYARADFIGRVDGSESPLPLLHSKRALVLHLRPGKYRLISCRIDDEVFDSFLAALDINNYEINLKHFIIGNKLTAEAK